MKQGSRTRVCCGDLLASGNTSKIDQNWAFTEIVVTIGSTKQCKSAVTTCCKNMLAFIGLQHIVVDIWC